MCLSPKESKGSQIVKSQLNGNTKFVLGNDNVIDEFDSDEKASLYVATKVTYKEVDEDDEVFMNNFDGNVKANRMSTETSSSELSSPIASSLSKVNYSESSQSVSSLASAAEFNEKRKGTNGKFQNDKLKSLSGVKSEELTANEEKSSN